MTELETLQRAKLYMDKLARGVDPVTDQEIPDDSVLNHVRLARCFYYVSDVLGQVIANGGVVGGKPQKQNFSITVEQLLTVPISQEPVNVSRMVESISAAINDPMMKKLKTTVITNWLLENGFLEKQTGTDGKSRRIPTKNGMMIGISIQTRQGPNGTYEAVYYNAEAQRFVLDHLLMMLADR